MLKNEGPKENEEREREKATKWLTGLREHLSHLPMFFSWKFQRKLHG